MVRFRTLTTLELQEFEKEFIQFLVVNGIEARDWEKMKIQENEKALELIDIFSDHIFESIFKKVQFLDLISSHHITSIQCLENKMIVIKAESETEIDEDAITYPRHLKTSFLEVPYSVARETELFLLTEKGYQISKGEIFKKLSLNL